jgi:preprotein translocase subunit SecA
MLKGITRFISGDPLAKQMERYDGIVARINALEPALQALGDEQLRGKTAEFRGRLTQGETLEDLLPEAFAVVREASMRALGLRHFDVQLVGGAALHEGNIVEMKTGEGKTLVATLPIYLNALTGRGVHLVTVNDYLARRDARWMGPIYHLLGMQVGVLQEAARTEHGRKAFLYDPERSSSQEDVHQLQLVDRQLAYAADVVYGTNNEFGFDYLRDNMAQSLEARSQRGHHYAILDEVDNILIDEARTPLIISGPSHEDPELYVEMARVVKQLDPEDFEINERDRTISLTEIGEDHVERLLGQPLRDPDRPEDISPEQARLLGFLEQGLRAEYLFKRNKDYVVQGGRVIIVDEFTGRMMPGRRWSDGLHQAVEAKEGVRVREDNVTYATITLQNYFRMYEKLAGMTGTAVTEAEEFSKIYKVDVIPLPTNLEYIASQPDSPLLEVEYREDGSRFQYYTRPDDAEQHPVFWRRKDYPDVVYRTEEAKLRAVTLEILRRQVLGQPLLVGTTSVELSEKLSGRLRAEPLQRLVTTQLLREAYLEAHGLQDEGMRVEEVQELYAPLDELSPSVLRAFARDLELSLNLTRPENLGRAAELLGLESKHHDRLLQALQGGIRHNVLNAKKHAEESQIIASAGGFGAVTIATNMAGRGVDIKLGGELPETVLGTVNRVLRRAGHEDPEDLSMQERLQALETADAETVGIYQEEIEHFRRFMQEQEQVREAGGLHVIGSERHEARRIDNQLRGRAARQGDPGSSQFFLSLEDELMRLFGGAQVSGLMQRLNIDDATPIAHGLVNKTIEQSQGRVEGANFDRRKHLLEYDDVLNQQREIFYGQRNRVFAKEDLGQDIAGMLKAEVQTRVQAALEDAEGPWRLLAWLEEVQPTLALETDRPYPSYMLSLLLGELEGIDEPDALRAELVRIAGRSVETQLEHVTRATEEQLYRSAERLRDQVRQRVELADMAIESALMEAEQVEGELDPRALLGAVESAAGMRIQTNGSVREQIQADPEAFRQQVPELIEASLGLRVWSGLSQAAARRLGQSLRLPQQLPVPIDWDAAAEVLSEELQRASQARQAQLSDDLERELTARLASGAALDRAQKTRLLVGMSYSQQTVFDRRTHQRREIILPRLSYAFYAAELLPSLEAEALVDSVLEHLAGAQQALQGFVGAEALTEYHRRLFLHVADRLWVEYLTEMEALRTSIGLEAYGQRDPLVQYKSRAVDMFRGLLGNIRAGVVARLFQLSAPQRVSLQADRGSRPSTQPGDSAEAAGPAKRRRRRRRR